MRGTTHEIEAMTTKWDVKQGWIPTTPYVFLANDEDSYYNQHFETREELEAFIAQLREASDKAFGNMHERK